MKSCTQNKERGKPKLESGQKMKEAKLTNMDLMMDSGFQLGKLERGG